MKKYINIKVKNLEIYLIIDFFFAAATFLFCFRRFHQQHQTKKKKQSGVVIDKNMEANSLKFPI